MAKQLLIIDNDDQSEAIDKINNLVKTKSFEIECHQFLVGLPDGNDVVDSDGRIDMKLVREKFQNEYGARRFHLMAFDVKLNDPDDGVDGVELIRSFNGLPQSSKTRKLLYSSELAEIVQGYLDHYKTTSNYDRAWEKFKTLINLEILDFCQREEYEKKIVHYIEKVIETENDYILDKLRGNQDLYFTPAIEIFQGLTLGQIADKIDSKD